MRRAGNSRWARSRERWAVTFLEMTVVIVILGTLLVLTIPSVGGFYRFRKLSTSAREVAVLFRYARGEAVFGETTTEVRLDMAGNRYQFRRGVDERASARERRRGQRLRGDEETVRHLPEGVTFADIKVWSQQVRADGVVVVEFFPNGTATPILVALKNEKGEARTVELSRASGRASILEGAQLEKALAGQVSVDAMDLVVEE